MDFFTLVGLSACIYFFAYVFFLWFSDCDFQLAFFKIFGRKIENIRGKVLWVTGASTALGQMMALEAARYGGKLALTSRSLDELKKIKVLCLKISPFLRSSDILVFHFDVDNINRHRDAVFKVLRRFGTIDILIMNEDKWEKGIWEETSQSTDKLLFQSNLFGVIALSRLIMKYFSLRGKGNLAIASSIAGLIGVPYSGCYTGAKHALHGYFNSLRYEKIGENIQITLLCLGSSELFQEKFTTKNYKSSKGQVTSRKKMTAERCAHLCLSAVINNLDEAWMAVFPVLPLIYGIKYFPNVTKALLKYLKPKEQPERSSTSNVFQ